jgi:4-carboxymuconolactone decarboxylase
VETPEAPEPRTASSSAVTPTEEVPSDILEDSLARLPLPRRDMLDADGRRAYDIITHPDSRYADGLWGPVPMWIYSPVVAEHIFPASSYLRFGTEKDQRLTELVILATAREVRSVYEWTQHEPPARENGLEPAIIDLVRNRADLDTAGEMPGLGDRERTIIAFVREVVTEEKLSSATFRRARELFGERGVVDLAGLVGYYGFVNITIKTFDLQLAPDREPLLPDLW